MNKDLTVGNPQKVIWQFCLPLFGSILFQQMYNLADSWVAGRFIGEDALAAVGNSYEITLIFLAFAFGCNIGCSIITSRFFGAKDYTAMKTAISTSMIASIVVCAALMLIGIFFGDGLLHLINTPDKIFADSKLYLDIYVYGVAFVFFYNIATGIFTALGDSNTPFKFLAVSSISNIAVDIYFVTGLKMGIAGVAWATFLCQGVSCVLALAVVLKRLKSIETPKKLVLFSVQNLKQFMVIAIPSTIQQAFISVGNIILQGIINGFGPGVIAGYSAGVKLNNLVITSYTTLANGLSNYTSQNLGAQKYERIGEGFKAGIKMVWTICIPVCALYMIFPDALLRFFMEAPSAAALSTGIMYLRILAPFYFVIAMKIIADGVLRGEGFMKLFMISTFSDLILRVVLAYIFSATALGSVGIWLAWPFGWIVGTILSITFYRKSKIRRE